MAFIHRAWFTWFLTLGFIILLTLNLDRRVTWNWFIIFIPLWLFDGVVIIYTLIKMIMHCKNGQWSWRNRHEHSTMGRKVWCLAAVLLKLMFQTLLCMKLQYFDEIKLRYVFLPFWILLCGIVVDVFRCLLSLARGT